ncbi:MAG: AEC family transporter [Oscillospiraceae bacterium]|nr:AEC family transporter [Oscillospiraceae bacterium]
MENLLLSVNAVMPIFLLMACGYLAQKLGAVSRQDVPRINRVAFHVFLPMLLFYNVYTSDLSSAVQPKLILFAVCSVLLVAAAALWGVMHFVDRDDRRGVIAQGIFRSNYVIMGLPIAEALVGADNLGPVTVLIAIVVPMFNFLAVMVLESFRPGRTKMGTVILGVIRNPLVVSSLAGIVFVLCGIHLPRLLEKTVQSLGSIATPLQLFLLGSFFRFGGLKRYRRELAVVTFIKLILTPAVFLSAAAFLGFRHVEFVALMGIFASPTAVNSFTMVQQMHCGDDELAGDIVVCTSLFCTLSFFLWIWTFKTLGVF